MATHNKQPVMIRAISLLVAMVFAVTTLVGSPSEAQAAAGAFEFLSGKNGMTQLRQGLNAIPSEWGTVNAIWEPAEKKPGSPFIVHMQDAHSSPEAAQNIASILNYLSEKHPEMVIGLEGASGALHPEYLNFFSDYPEANLAVINDLKQKGELNGADLFLLGKGRPSGREIQVGNISLEYGSLSSVKPSEVRGVETAELYLEDLRIFRDLLSKQDEMQVLLNPIRSRLEKESSQKLNGELRDFLKERSRRKEGRFGLNMQTGLLMTPARSRGLAAPSSQADPNLLAYANYLCKQVLKFLGIDLSDSIEQLRFPNLMRVQRIAEAQQKFDTEKIQAEWTEVLKVLTALAKDTGEQDFFAALATFAREQGFIDEAAGREFSYPVERALYPRKLLEGLFLFKQKHPIDLARYGAFLKSWDLVALHAEIEVTELLKEMAALEDQLVLVLAKTDEEKELVRQISQLDLLEKLLKLELSRPEYDGVIASREAIAALAKDQGSLAPFLEQAFLFYEVSLKRDNALVENLLALTRGDRGTGNVPRVLVLYTGGFHSAGIEEILRSKGIGYAEIAPKTRSVDRGELYQKVMAGDNADLTAYFKVKNPFSTKQEAIFFKELVEIGAPALFEKYQLKPDQIASSVRQAIDAHPVLSKVVMAERPSGQHEGSSVTFQTRPSASVQSANSAAMPPDLLGSGLPVSTGGTRLEARTTVEFSTPPTFHTEIRPEFAHPMPLRNESAQVPSQRRAEIRITQEALRGILQGKPEDVALAMLGLYEDGSLLAPEYSLIFSEFGIDPSKFDLGIEAAGDMIIRRELKTKNLKLYRGGSETNVYRGTVNGNDILVKEIRLDSAVADSVWENHVANQEKLGGLVANYTTIKDLEVMVEGEMHTIHYAIVQEFATPLLDRVAKIQDEKENVEDKTEEIEALMKTYLDLYPEFLRRGFVPKPNGFLLDMGRTEEGRIVALDIGDLLPAESPDGVRLLKIIQHPNKFWDLLLAESFMSYFIPGNGDEVAQTAKDPLMSGRGGGPRPGVSVFKKEGTFLSKHTAGYSLLVSPSDMFSGGGQKDPKTYAFSERVRQGIFPAGIRESLNTNASVHRTTYLGNVNIREAIRSARLKYVRSFLRTREMSGIIEPDGFKLVLVDPKDIEPNAVLEGNPTGMGMTEGEIVYFDPAQKRIDRSIVRPHDSVEDQRMKLDNEIAAFRKALQTIDGQIEPETRALWGNFQSEVEEAIRIKKERGEYAVGALILRERQKIERMIHPLEAQNLREALFVLEKSLLPLLEDREALTYLSFEDSHSSEELSKRLVEHEDRRAVIKVLQILLKLPYGFSAPSETAQKDERTWAAGVQFAVGELVGDMRSMIRQNRSAKRAAKVMISSDHKIAKQIQVNKEKLKAKPNDKTANRNLTTYEALKEIFETVQQDLSEYDYVFNETDTPEARTGKIGDNLLVHQAVEKAVFARTAFQLTPEMKLRFDSHMMKEISKGRTLQYAVAAFLYTSFVEENMMVFFDQQLMNYLMAYYHFSVFGKTEQTPDKNIIVVASSIRNETEYASLLREAGIYGKVVAIGTLEVGYEVSGKNRFPHWYIFARQSGIVPIFPMHPVVPKSREIKISNGGWAMVDGQRGQIMQNPDKKTAEDWRKRGEGYRHMKQFFENRAALPAAFNNKPFFYRYDAVNPSLFRPQPGGAIATRLGGKGIGLYRMEAQLSDSKNPGAEENEEFISAPIKDILGQDYFSVPENALIVRLYDVQDDKRPGMLRESRDYQEIEAILAEHSNVRFYIYSDEELAKSPGLAQFREFGKHQLRALFDAKRTHPDRILKILFSNVRESREIDEIEKLVREAREDYLRQIPEEEKIRVATLLETVPLGYMIEETETADRLDSIFEKIKEVSAPKNKDAAPFIAIGSNDLVKSILNQHQTKFGSEWNLSNIHPQFAADLYRIGNLAKKYGFNVNLEGEWASSRRVLLLLLALHHFYGLDNVIPVAEPSDVPKLLEYVRNTTPDDLEKGGWLRASFQKILKKVIAGDETIPSLTLNRALYELQHKIEQRIFQREDFKAFKAAAEAGTWKIRSEMRRIEETGAMAGLMGVAASARSLQQLQTGNFDLVITDVTMPLMGGIELAENMRTGGINLPVIFMSGATSWKSSRGSWIKIDDLKKREPYADFLQKPFMASNMEAAIQKISSRSEARVEKVTDEAVIGNALDFALRSHNIPNALNIIESEAYSWERRGRDSAFLELIDAIAWEMKTMLEKLKAPNVQIVRNKEFQAIFLGNVGWGSNPDTVDVDSEAWAKYKTKLDLGKDIVRMQEKADLIRGIIGNLTPEATNLSPVKEASQSIRAIVEEIHQKIFPSDQAAANKPVALFRPSPRPTMPVDRVESISSKTPKVEDVDQLKRELARDLQRNILKETLGSSTEFVAKLIASWRWKTPGKAESVAVDVKEFRGSLDRLTSDQLRNLATAVMNNKQPPSYGSYELSGLNSRLSEWETNKLGNIFSWQETAREKARLADARGDFEDRNRYDLAAVIKADDWAKIKNILASAYAKDLVLPRSEVRMSNTDDYKRELEQNTTPTAELSVQSEMLGAINSTAKQLGFYSEQGIASYASGWSSVQIRSWIASQLLAPLRMMATEQKISNEKLKTILDGLKQFVANGAAEKPDLLGQGPALHVRLPQLSEAQWQAFLKDVPVLLGALVSFRANIYFNVHADSKRAAEMETELRQTVRAEGVELADRQVRFFSIPEGSGFASLKTGKVDARLSEEVRYLQLGSKLGTAWKGSEESKVDMRTLAAEITTVLYAILDEKVNADWNRIHAPEQYSSELFRAVLGALEAYESIKQAA